MSKFEVMWKKNGSSLKDSKSKSSNSINNKIEKITKEIAEIKTEMGREQIRAEFEMERHNIAMSELMFKDKLILKICGMLSISEVNTKDSLFYGNSQLRSGPVAVNYSK